METSNAAIAEISIETGARLRYPLILVICWTFPTINRLQQVFQHGEPIFGLYVMTTLTKNLMGLLNALAFASTPAVRREWVSLLGIGAAPDEAKLGMVGNDGSPRKSLEMAPVSAPADADAEAGLEDVDLGGPVDGQGLA